MPVAASAIAIEFLAVPLFMRVSRQYVDLCLAILFLEAGVGVWGFVLHAAGNLRGPSIHAFDNFIYAPHRWPRCFFPILWCSASSHSSAFEPIWVDLRHLKQAPETSAGGSRSLNPMLQS